MRQHTTSAAVSFDPTLLEFEYYIFILYSQVLKAEYFSSWKEEQQMYKLDIGWPKSPEHFTGQTFCVAVDSLHGLVYVGQVSGNTVFVSVLCLWFFAVKGSG